MVVTSRSFVSAHEIEALLNRLVGPNPRVVNTMNYIAWGAARAFGMVGGLRFIDEETGDDVTEQARLKYPGGPEAFDHFFSEQERDLNRRTLDGPTPDDEPELRKLGWDPTGAFEVANRRAAQELEQVARFNADPAWRRGRIRDVVAARELLIEINEALSRALSERGGLPLEALGDPAVLDSMPSFDVAVTLKTEYHRDPGHRWTAKDIHDIDALGSTLPYCDIVVTDKAAASHVVRTGLADRLQTIVLPRLSDVIPFLG